MGGSVMELVNKEQAEQVQHNFAHNCNMKQALERYEQDKFKLENIKYTDENGNQVVVLSQPITAADKCVIAFKNYGRWFCGSSRIADLTPISKCDHIKIDDPVIVWDNDIKEEKEKRHFAGVKDGKPAAFVEGKTSFTAEDSDDWVTWDNCELYRSKTEREEKC